MQVILIFAVPTQFLHQLKGTEMGSDLLFPEHVGVSSQDPIWRSCLDYLS